LTISVVIFEREEARPFFSAKPFWKPWEFSIFRDHLVCSWWRLILDEFLELFACVRSLVKLFAFVHVLGGFPGL